MKIGFSKIKTAGIIAACATMIFVPVLLGGNKVSADETDTPVLDGWVTDSDITYYYENGIALTGWQEIAGDRYYFYKTTNSEHKMGQMATGFLSDSGVRYYLLQTATEDQQAGAMACGWQEIDGSNFYFYKSKKDGHVKGQMATGWLSYEVPDITSIRKHPKTMPRDRW